MVPIITPGVQVSFSSWIREVISVSWGIPESCRVFFRDPEEDSLMIMFFIILKENNQYKHSTVLIGLECVINNYFIQDRLIFIQSSMTRSTRLNPLTETEYIHTQIKVKKKEGTISSRWQLLVFLFFIGSLPQSKGYFYYMRASAPSPCLGTHTPLNDPPHSLFGGSVVMLVAFGELPKPR